MQTSEERKRWLPRYLGLNNQRRCHKALGGLSPQQHLVALLAECPGEKAHLSGRPGMVQPLAREVDDHDGEGGAMEGIHQSDRASLPQRQHERGRPAGPLATWPQVAAQQLLRIDMMQQFYSRNDPGRKGMLIEVATIRRITGIDMISDRIPDETTNLGFQHLHEKHNLGEQIVCSRCKSISWNLSWS